CRNLSAVVLEAGLPDELPKPARVSPRPLAPGLAGQPRHGLGARDLLPGLLLGADDRSRGRRRDEPALGARHRGRRDDREARATWRMDRTIYRRRTPAPRRGRRPLA